MKKLTIALLAILAFGATNVAAQNATVTIPEVLVVQSVDNLVITGDQFDFSSSDQATASGSVNITTRSNIVHAVEVSSTDLVLGGVVLPFEVIDVNGAPQDLTAGTFRVLQALPRGNQSNSITFQATGDIATHDPGDYQGTITYTVVAN